MVNEVNHEDEAKVRRVLKSLENFKDHYDTSYEYAEPDNYEIIEFALIQTISFKPLLSDHDHEDYFTKRVKCGCCKKPIGSWDYGREWCDGSKEYFIEHHKYCNECGRPIDWTGVM